MHRLSWPRMVATAVATGLLAWFVTWWRTSRGNDPFPVPWTVVLVLLAVAVVVIALGWMVRQYQHGDRPDLDPLLAARTAILAQAAAYAGAALAGTYAGHAFALVGDWGHEPRRVIVIAALVAFVGAVVLVVAGFIAERWCATKSDDGDGSGKSPNVTPEAA